MRSNCFKIPALAADRSGRLIPSVFIEAMFIICDVELFFHVFAKTKVAAGEFQKKRCRIDFISNSPLFPSP